MSSMRINAYLDTPHHGLKHPFKETGAVVDSLTGVNNVMVKCLFVFKSSCIHKGFKVFPWLKIHNIRIYECGGHAVGRLLPIHWS